MMKAICENISIKFFGGIFRHKGARHARRTVITAASLFLILAAFLCAGVIVRAQSENAPLNEKIYYTNVTVDKGDTLWNIAEEYMDYGHYDNIYEYMEHLTKLNHLTSDNLYAGEHLIVTYYASEESGNINQPTP
ncbi:MAG: LysM peptidoglycan-binding domain-containing protein [Butyrivibrio sp.]|nr:LysM peptidoglycan-binding domain-containing protein [Butyrivibrio sp.]